MPHLADNSETQNQFNPLTLITLRRRLHSRFLLSTNFDVDCRWGPFQVSKRALVNVEQILQKHSFHFLNERWE